MGEYSDEKNRYYESDHFKTHYKGKWVARAIPKPNHESPLYASKASLNMDVIASTIYIYKAAEFPSREAAETFIKQRRRVDYKPYCL